MCEKLEGKIIFLPILWERNESILKNHMNQIFNNKVIASPFEKPEWLNSFTPREVISIADNVKLKFDFYKKRNKGYEVEGGDFFNCIFIREFIYKYIDKLNITDEKIRNALIRVSNSTKSNNDLVDSFYNSLNSYYSNNILIIINKIKNSNQINLPYNNNYEQNIINDMYYKDEDSMLKFFDETASHWIDNNEKNALT